MSANISVSDVRDTREAVSRTPGPAVPPVRARGRYWCEAAAARTQGPAGRDEGVPRRPQADEPPAHIDECADQGYDYLIKILDKCSLLIGTIPDHWRRYKVSKSMAVSAWIVDFGRRLVQLNSIAGADTHLAQTPVWLGGLFFPEAYITATRQAVAHRKKWSLETLHLRLDLERVNDPAAFVVDGLVLEGRGVGGWKARA